MEFLTLNQEAFGLDISDLSLKIIKLKKRGEFLGLASFGEAEIMPGIIVEGEIKDEEALAKIIRDALKKVRGEKLKTKYVIASLPEEKAFLQVIQLPIMDEEDLKSAVRFEAENYVPLPIEEVYLDFQMVPPIYNHLDHLDVLLAAQPKKIVDGYLNSIKKAGLILKVLEIESQSIARALVKDELSPFPTLLVDLGASRTSFIVFSGYSLRFTATIPVSSQKFTEAISKTLKKDLAEAEKLKIKYGLKREKKDEWSERVFEAMIPALTDLIEQIKRYLSFYQTHTGHEHLPPDGKGVTKIFLCGGGANLKGLADFLTLEFKIPVEIGNPWVNILPKPLKEVPELPYEKSLSYTTALGLAMRGVREK
ncbi:pilus assembly protein PilM [Patescibacteria group bacterium]|nr:pilus assembly protein PilM [Patescibacteria group bacterium]MBU4481381.1 pilus assembly protein PilM [Patescibacteria group bacterium]